MAPLYATKVFALCKNAGGTAEARLRPVLDADAFFIANFFEVINSEATA